MSVEDKINKLNQSMYTVNGLIALRQDLIKLRKALELVVSGGNSLGIYEQNMGQIMLPGNFIRDYVEEQLVPDVGKHIEEIERTILQVNIKGV